MVVNHDLYIVAGHRKLIAFLFFFDALDPELAVAHVLKVLVGGKVGLTAGSLALVLVFVFLGSPCLLFRLPVVFVVLRCNDV